MEKRMLKVLIVDDEAPARRRLRDVLGDIAAEVAVSVVGEAANGTEALAAIEREPVDLAFVDVRMPEMDGIELARHLARLEHPPAVVFVTAFGDYAVQAFEVNAVDYLLKPARAERLQQAIERATRAAPLAVEAADRLADRPRRHLSCSERGRIHLIPIDDVLYFKADLKYVTARTAAREFLLDESLLHLEKEFSDRLIRLHRSVLASRTAITGFEKDDESLGEGQWLAVIQGVPEKLPISRRQWSQVRATVGAGSRV